MIIAFVSLILALGGTVDSAHQERFRLMVANDLPVLAKTLGDELVYVHSDGVVETKTQFLDRLRSGSLRYRSISPAETLVRSFGNVAIVTGRARVGVTMAGADRDVDMRYTSVYARKKGRWMLVSWQSTGVR